MYGVSFTVWRFRHAIAVFLALCTQEFFRLGVLAYLEGVYNVLTVIIWVCGMFITVMTELVVVNLWAAVTMGVTGTIVLKLIERLCI